MQTNLVLEVDAGSLRVHDGIGGMQPLGDLEKESIRETIDEEILKRMDIEFRSTAVQEAPKAAFSVQGDLRLVGTTRPSRSTSRSTLRQGQLQRRRQADRLGDQALLGVVRGA